MLDVPVTWSMNHFESITRDSSLLSLEEKEGKGCSDFNVDSRPGRNREVLVNRFSRITRRKIIAGDIEGPTCYFECEEASLREISFCINDRDVP